MSAAQRKRPSSISLKQIEIFETTDDALDLSNNPLCERMLKQRSSGRHEREKVIYSEELMKITSNGKFKKRVLLMTDRAIYNLLPSNVSKCKLRVNLKSIASVTVSTISRQEFIIYKSNNDKLYRYKSINKERLITLLNKSYVKQSKCSKSLTINKFAKSIQHIVKNKTVSSNSSNLLVYGYVRDCIAKMEQRRSNMIVNINIMPAAIYDIMLLYCDDFECFQNYNAYIYVALNGGMKRTFTMMDYGHSTCYGCIRIPSVNNKIIYQWRFKIVKRSDSMAIGIDETKYKWKDTNFAKCQMDDEATKSYGLYNDGKRSACGYIIGYYENEKKRKVLQYKTNDIIDMILNLNDNTLSYIINGAKQLEVFRGVKKERDIEYCLAIYAYNKGDSVRLLETRMYNYN